MIARNLITDSVPSVKTTDTIGYALDWMNEFKLTQLPLVDGGEYKGMITENDILDAPNLEIPVNGIKYSGWNNAYVHAEKHVYEVISMMSKLRLELLPVLDDDNHFLGVISFRDLVAHLGGIFAVQEPGGIIVLEVAPLDYSISEIGRIIESADAKAMSLYVSDLQRGNNKLLITLKLNVEELTRVIAAFERFDYKVLDTYYNMERQEDYQRNLDAFFKFLDI